MDMFTLKYLCFIDLSDRLIGLLSVTQCCKHAQNSLSKEVHVLEQYPTDPLSQLHAVTFSFLD